MLAVNLLIALALTIIIECFIAFAMGYRRKSEILAVILVNTLTNPLLNYIVLAAGILEFLDSGRFIVVILEIAVVFVEWRVLLYVLGRGGKRLLLLSVVMNTASYVTGLLIYR